MAQQALVLTGFRGLMHRGRFPSSLHTGCVRPPGPLTSFIVSRRSLHLLPRSGLVVFFLFML